MRTAWMAILLTWLVTAGIVWVGVRRLGGQVREQIVRRDAEVLQAMARAQASSDDPDALLSGEPFAMFVTIGRFEGILAARMFDSNGVFLASVPDRVREVNLGAKDLEVVRTGRTVSRFHAAVVPGDVFLPVGGPGEEPPAPGIPMVEVLVPLPGPAGRGLAGVAGFLLEGSSVAREFELLDRRLARDAGLVLLIGLAVTGGILGWAFWQLQRSHRLLARRTRDLQEANRELAQTARVASLGAVTAHLVHGLKNPVAGLQSFVAAGAEGGGADTGAWADALEATRRMQAMIQQVVRVVREEESGTSFEIPLPEFAEAVLARARALAEARGVRVEGRLDDGRALDNRRSGLMALLVSNLMENAIQATPAGGTVRLNLRGHAGGWVAEVADEGPGIPEKVRGRLFQPVQSTKEGGSGLGLAITRQLASAMGGTVSLAETGERGSRFVVEIPHP